MGYDMRIGVSKKGRILQNTRYDRDSTKLDGGRTPTAIHHFPREDTCELGNGDTTPQE